MDKEKRSLANPGYTVPSWKGVISKTIIHSLYIRVFYGCDTTVRPCGMSKVMNNLIFGECAHTFTGVNSTRKDVEAGDLMLKLIKEL